MFYGLLLKVQCTLVTAMYLIPTLEYEIRTLSYSGRYSTGSNTMVSWEPDMALRVGVRTAKAEIQDRVR